MSAPHLVSIARGCRAYVLFCLLAIPASGFGQILAPIEPINPIIGPMVRIVSPADHIGHRLEDYDALLQIMLARKL